MQSNCIKFGICRYIGGTVFPLHGWICHNVTQKLIWESGLLLLNYCSYFIKLYAERFLRYVTFLQKCSPYTVSDIGAY